MHRDFKLANVLLHNNVCKIADLGFSKQLKNQSLTTTILGTDETMAPEVNEGKSYGWGADIWSIGVVFYQMMFKRLPFKGNQYTIKKNMKLQNIDFDGIVIS
jgi:serine/threonine protein kinase